MRTSLFVFVAALVGPLAQAQVLEPPPRSTEGRFERRHSESERPTSTLVTDANLLLGYDDNVDAGSGVPFAGYSGTGSTSTRFGWGTTRQALGFGGRGYLTRYESTMQKGGSVFFDGVATLGRRNQLNGGISVANEPVFLAGVRTTLSDTTADVSGTGAVDPGSTRGVTSQQSRQLSLESSFRRTWSTRHSTLLTVSGSDTRPTGDIGFQNRDFDAGARHAWTVTRSVSLLGSYSYSEETAEDVGGTVNTQRLDSHTTAGGVGVTKRLSPRRSIVVEATSGVAALNALNTATGLPTSLNAPFVAASIRLDVGRSWALSSDVRRDVGLVTGLSPSPFSTDTVFVNVGGSLGRRVSLVTAGSYSRGRARDTDTGEFSSLSTMLQSQYEFTPRVTLVASYTYYRHNVQQVIGVPSGFPTTVELNSVRLGLTLRFPLIQPRRQRG